MKKPSYTTTKRALWISSGLAWAVILIVVIAAVLGSSGAISIAPLVVPAMVALIPLLLGVHRHYGSRDMETMSTLPAPEGEQP